MFEKFNPKKSLGQNFLKNPSTINLINDIIDIKKSDYVIEIGPGMGAISENILEKTENYVGIEKDPNLSDYLKKKYKKNIRIINEDVLKVEFSNIYKKKYRVIGNIPYNISTEVIIKCIENRIYMHSAFFMMQKEFVDRIQSQYGNKIFGRLSVFCQIFFDINKYIDISPKDFYPEPKVQSSFFSLKPKKKILLEKSEIEGFLIFVKEIFKTRRKKIKNCISIKSGILYDNIEKRAEQLSIEDMINLYRELKHDGKLV